MADMHFCMPILVCLRRFKSPHGLKLFCEFWPYSLIHDKEQTSGGDIPCTITVKLHSPLFPAASTASRITSVLPRSN